MLSELTIENIAVIDKASINFTCGFNCLTGETGAGKSIIIDAINCITGEKTSRELIRSGENFARVTAVFSDISDRIRQFLTENDIDLGDDDLIFSRKITRDGRNSCHVNGVPVPVAFLRSVGDLLVNIHGQMDSKNLLDPDRHFHYIDLFGQTKPLFEKYQQDYNKLSAIRNEIKRLSVDESEKLKEIDMLDFRIEELSAAGLHVGETQALRARREVCRNAKKIADVLSLADSLLNGDAQADGAADLAASAADSLDALQPYMQDMPGMCESLRDISYSLSDIGSRIKDKLEEVSYSDDEMNELEERLDYLIRLSKKYGDSEEDMIAFLEKSVKRREEIELSEDRLNELNLLFDEAATEAKKSAKALSRARREAAAAFAARVEEELRFLDMPDVSFFVADTIVPLNENGVDNMCFMFSANKGEQAKPLSKIASGGELSRVMLAVKNVLSGCDDVATLIFDEIDTGVSGRAAEKIARKLYEVSLGRQVICVTHLAQLAGFADTHFLIEKNSDSDRTFTSVRPLDREGRANELARIGGGMHIGKLQLDNARQMMKDAENYKNDFKKINA